MGKGGNAMVRLAHQDHRVGVRGSVGTIALSFKAEMLVGAALAVLLVGSRHFLLHYGKRLSLIYVNLVRGSFGKEHGPMQMIDEIKSVRLREEAAALIEILKHEHIQLYGQVVEKFLLPEFCARRPNLAERIYKELMAAFVNDLISELVRQHPQRTDESASEYEVRIVDLIEKELKAKPASHEHKP